MGQPRPLFVYFRTFQTSRCLSILFVCCGPFSTNKPLSSFSISLFLFHLTCNGKKRIRRGRPQEHLCSTEKTFFGIFLKNFSFDCKSCPYLRSNCCRIFFKIFWLACCRCPSIEARRILTAKWYFVFKCFPRGIDQRPVLLGSYR